MRRLIAYDIADDRRRRRAARLLEKRGIRLQRSVFVAEGGAGTLRALERELEDLLEEGDSLLILPCCESCFASARMFHAEAPAAMVA